MTAEQIAALRAGQELNVLQAAAPILLAALETAPVHRLDETPEQFIERYKFWYREIRNQAIKVAKSER